MYTLVYRLKALKVYVFANILEYLLFYKGSFNWLLKKIVLENLIVLVLNISKFKGEILLYKVHINNSIYN